MLGFFKSFFAALSALAVFTVLVVLILLALLKGFSSTKKPSLGDKAVLVLDLGQTFSEQARNNPLSGLVSGEEEDVPGLYDLIRLLRNAKGDTVIKGIYLKCNNNSNGFAGSEEIRNALLDFKKSGKFIYAYGEVIPQKAYYVANVADRIFCNPKGGVEWKGLSVEMSFLKGTLQKLEIDPQIFYAGKFKSATEPLREDKMTEANRLQLSELLNGLFDRLLLSSAQARGLDTAVLRKCVNEDLIRYAKDALEYKLVDGLAYDDQVKAEIVSTLKLKPHDPINFISVGKYARAADYKSEGKGRIALIYAQGDIVDGKGQRDEIGADTYIWLIRKASYDKEVGAIVIRVNSGGGSSMASENLWREISIAKMEKPVVVSFGDLAASGGYYMSCNADSIFADPNTITGSIGVFSVIPNMKDFFRDKLGVTFDRVRTAPGAGVPSIAEPLSAAQKMFFQNEVDSIYQDFKTRVADGRKRKIGYVDSIGQGRVWSGEKGMELGLVDRLGGLQDAIDCAARMGKTGPYTLKEYPEPRSWLDIVLGNYTGAGRMKAVKEELGEDGYRTYITIKKVKGCAGIPQTRLPFDMSIE
jgi:protease IV